MVVEEDCCEDVRSGVREMWEGGRWEPVLFESLRFSSSSLDSSCFLHTYMLKLAECREI